MASGPQSSPPSIPTKNEMLTLLDLFEIKDVRAAIEAYWPYDDELPEPGDRESQLRRENDILKCQNNNMLKVLQDMAKKNEHVKAEMEEIAEALLAADFQWSDHERAKQQAVALQNFLG